MNKKKQFTSPKILQNVEVCLERDILQESFNKNSGVYTMGQGAETLEFTNDGESGDYTAEWN